MPLVGEAAEVVLIDTHRNNLVTVVDRTRAWNFQQGTMFYWNPEQAETQFFFNDRDPETNQVFAVLYDIVEPLRVREYRFADTPIGNSGVAQNGGHFLGINYGRLSRLRPVTGYPGAFDWTDGEVAPGDDGVFKVDVSTGEKQLLVSFRQVYDILKPTSPHIDTQPLFINHTLWNRDDDRIYFYVRGEFGNRERRINTPFVVVPDGSGLTPQPVFIGGHPEWAQGHRMIGSHDGRQVFYDTDQQQIVGTIANREVIPDPEADVALSPDGKCLANGYEVGTENFYVLYRLSDGAFTRSRGFDHTGWTDGDLRIDGAPCWNRTSDKIVFTAIADDAEKTRQMFVLEIR
ncbi:MAG: hypothetical protein R3B91_14540 [Planctomycetaceae bacterium]